MCIRDSNVSLPPNAGEDSHSLLSAFQDKETIRPPMVHHGMSGPYAIRYKSWKLVMESEKSKRELYNIENDPGEKKNVISNHPALTKSLEAQLTEVIRTGRSTPGQPSPNDTDLWSDLVWIQ